MQLSCKGQAAWTYGMGVWHLDKPNIEDGVHFAFCVVGKGNSETHRRMETSRDHGHLELQLDHAYMRREMEDRESSILVGRFSASMDR